MRVIAGSLKGRRLQPPGWEGLRPTSDKLRETLFNVLAPRVAGARVLDLYAGTGALGIEALSRGASEVVFVEADRRAQALIAGNLARCGVENGYAIIRGPVAPALRALGKDPRLNPFDIVLIDPPYGHEAPAALQGVDAVMALRGVAVLEHARRHPGAEHAGRLVRVRELRSGDSALSFYELDSRQPGFPR